MRTRTKRKIINFVDAAEENGRFLMASLILPLALFGVPLLIWGLWALPINMVGARVRALRQPISLKDRVDLEDTSRSALVQLFGGGAVLIGVYFTYRTVRTQERNLEVTREGQLSERYGRAAEQVGSENREVRRGGIYALEQVARESKNYHGPVMEFLTDHLRERHPRSGMLMNEPDDGSASPDVQAVMTVIGRRLWYHDSPKRPLDLRSVCLRHISLNAPYLENVLFDGSSLCGAVLRDAKLEGASFVNADLDTADLQNADMRGVDLKDAALRNAALQGANLSLAVNLTREQLGAAHTSEKTRLPRPLQANAQDAVFAPKEDGAKEGEMVEPGQECRPPDDTAESG